MARRFLLVAAAATSAAVVRAQTSGAFSFMTYNVAGLPELLSSGNPSVNTPLISARLGPYSIIHVQEDFNYHAALYASDNHPYRTATSGGVPFGSGLNTLSNYDWSEFERIKWNKCDNNEADCLTPKGFTVMRVKLAPGVYIDFYNLHADAGSESGDIAARQSNFQQVIDKIATYSAGNAVIIGGDTNTRYTRVGEPTRKLLTDPSPPLTDPWVSLIRGGSIPVEGSAAIVCTDVVTSDCEVVDKIFFRSSKDVILTATQYRNENAKFLDSAGNALSDHWPHVVEFSWSTGTYKKSDAVGGTGGDPFNDLASLPDNYLAAGDITVVNLRGANRLDAVSLTYSTGATKYHGGSGGDPYSLTLRAGEYLTSATFTTGDYNGSNRLFSASFTTNQGRTVSTGKPTSASSTFTAPSGTRIIGLFGRSGNEVDKLGVVYAPLP